MGTSSDLQKEILKLKSDAGGRRSRRRRDRTSAAKAKLETQSDVPDAGDTQTDTAPAWENSIGKSDLDDLAHKLSGLVDEAESEIREQPVTMVLGAFALGLVVGALLRR
ncbi:hypothetical protein J7444_05560 [Labrenzia sp. R4_1]|uniref:hypothetical protein n=1 Tax=Labrenzia sp. R4_1 TaxID=2821106 RepID=UPI001ADC29F9|nr:hypothetical protein [Labrenzia sp. R4_1]MBO9424176.1 hypothetical protein [Labrenzia sp. R4_1]